MFFDDKYFRKAVKLTIPIFFGYISIGIPFGLMVASAGYKWWMALFMCMMMYSGTGQYIGIALFASGIPADGTFFSTILYILGIQFFVGFRHAFYGLSLLERYRGTGIYKPFLIYFLTDETFAITSTCDVPKNADKGKFYFTISIMDFSYWCLGSVIGALAGQLIPPEYLNGVDFALTTLFVVLMLNQILSTKDFVPSFVGIATAIIAIALSYIQIDGHRILPSQHVILVGLALGIASIVFMRRNKLETC